MSNAPILVVEDDNEDREFLQNAWQQANIPNALLFLNDGMSVLQYLETENVPPFLILCDVNLPFMDGFELKQKIQENKAMNYKSIPFVFWSTEASKMQIQKAYDLGGNGFFLKGNTIGAITKSLLEIVHYWSNSRTPSNSH